MIFVDRSTVPKPTALDGEISKAAQELAAARQHFAQSNPGSFHFKIYKDATVKSALEKLFHGKCAYCETKYEANQPVDIEHYRPKSAYMVDGKLTKPGYWWLAADWTNLLPSCIDWSSPTNSPPTLLKRVRYSVSSFNCSSFPRAHSSKADDS